MQKQWSLTPTPLQINITEQTRIVPMKGDKSLKCPLGLTGISGLRDESENNINVAGVITKLTTETRQGTERRLVTIRDKDADVHVSFQNAALKDFKGQIGDVLLVRNALCKVYTNYVVIRGNAYNYSLNERHSELDNLKDYVDSFPPRTMMSPPKDKPKEVKSIEDLQHNECRQQIKASPSTAQIRFYNMCPVVGCRRRMHQNEYSGIYSCDSCNKQYVTSADGVTLNLGIVQEGKTVEMTLFNDVALHFLQAPLSMLKENKDDVDVLIEPLKKNTYNFQILAGKTKGEFICQETTLVEKYVQLGENNPAEEVLSQASSDRDLQPDTSEDLPTIVRRRLPVLTDMNCGNKSTVVQINTSDAPQTNLTDNQCSKNESENLITPSQPFIHTGSYVPLMLSPVGQTFNYMYNQGFSPPINSFVPVFPEIPTSSQQPSTSDGQCKQSEDYMYNQGFSPPINSFVPVFPEIPASSQQPSTSDGQCKQSEDYMYNQVFSPPTNSFVPVFPEIPASSQQSSTSDRQSKQSGRKRLFSVADILDM